MRKLSGILHDLKSQSKTDISRKTVQYILLTFTSCLLIYFVPYKTMPGPTIEKWNAEKDGVLNEANLTRKLERQGYNCIKYTFSPGTDFPDHTHAVSKKDAILTGRFEFGMHGQTVVLEPGDMVEVPRNTVHNARVVGKENVVFFDSTK